MFTFEKARSDSPSVLDVFEEDTVLLDSWSAKR
jgi:hypothetical protein